MSSWDDVRRRLETDLLDLADAEFVVVGEPEPPRSPARGLLRRRAAPEPARYVQVRRDGDHWYAECVGATSFGGDWDVDEVTHERLRSTGWLVPGEEDPTGVQPSYPNYWKVLPRAEAGRAASLCSDALALLGADPSTLEWRRDA
ncbi:MAG TPA: hypothetical protein VGV65_10645 [Nocardioides sp.]|nr:hypothetical protein [Nocardioides sp.]